MYRTRTSPVPQGNLSGKSVLARTPHPRCVFLTKRGPERPIYGEMVQKSRKHHRLNSEWCLSQSYGADDGSRTRDLRLGKATLYQLSYVRSFSEIERTGEP